MAPSRGAALLCPSESLIRLWAYQRCRARGFNTITSVQSGHNRWSKIKHDKGKADAVKNRQRSIFAQEIATASRLFGGDPGLNPRLADLITKAKREGFAKASIEAAIARGQGKSSSGASLESVTVEGILPNNIAVIVECETDSKLRTLAEVRLVIKAHGGTTTPSSYLFAKRGKITFEVMNGIGLDEALEPALDAGATDVEEDMNGRIVVSTAPGDTKAVGEAMSRALGVQIATSEILWDPNEDTKIGLSDVEAADSLLSFIDELQEKENTIQSVALNVSQGRLATDTWTDLQNRLGA